MNQMEKAQLQAQLYALSGSKDRRSDYLSAETINKQKGWTPSMGLPAESWTKMFDLIKFCQNSAQKMKRYPK